MKKLLILILLLCVVSGFGAMYPDAYYDIYTNKSYVYATEASRQIIFDLKRLPEICWTRLYSDCQVVIKDTTGAYIATSKIKNLDTALHTGYVKFPTAISSTVNKRYKLFFDTLQDFNAAACTTGGGFLDFSYDDSVSYPVDDCGNYNATAITATRNKSGLWGKSIQCNATSANHTIASVSQLKGAEKVNCELRFRAIGTNPTNACAFSTSDGSNHYIFTAIYTSPYTLTVYIGSNATYWQSNDTALVHYMFNDSLHHAINIYYDGTQAADSNKIQVWYRAQKVKFALTGSIPAALPDVVNPTVYVGTLADGTLPFGAYVDNFYMSKTVPSNYLADNGNKWLMLTANESMLYRYYVINNIVFNSDTAYLGKTKSIAYSGLTADSCWVDTAVNGGAYHRKGKIKNQSPYIWNVNGTVNDLVSIRFVDKTDTTLISRSNSLHLYWMDIYTKQMLHFNGNTGSTSCIDECGHAYTSYNNASITTTNKKLGSGAGSFNSTNWFTSPAPDLFSYRGNQWTIDFWIRLNKIYTVDTVQYFAGRFKNYVINNNKLDSINFDVHSIYPDGSYRFESEDSDHKAYSPQFFTPPISWDTGWHHVEIAVDYLKGDTACYGFLDGDSIGLINGDLLLNASMGTNYSPFKIGAGKGSVTLDGHVTPWSGANQDFNGQIDEFRITMGKVRHTTSFTAATVEYGDSRLDSIAGNRALSTASYKRVKRNDTLSFYVAGLPDSSATSSVFMNTLSCRLTKWSNSIVKAIVPTTAASGYYRNCFISTNGTTAFVTSGTPIKVMVFGFN